jgi:CubicO group peptidase (beta-lactamase class C family)
MRALAQVDSWPVPTVSAAALSGGAVIATHGPTDHAYRLASIAKIVTAITVLVAVEEGTVQLDDPVGHAGCTLRHLLSHAGGYPFDGAEPIARPGTRRIYSNTGIELAADHLAARAGMPFGDYLQAAVVEPLGLRRTELRGSPAHALWASLDDTAALAAELARPTLLAPDTAVLLRTVQFPGLPGIVPGVGRYDDCTWALGAEVRNGKRPHWTGATNSPATFGHFGGAGTMLWVDPVADIALVALTDRMFDEWADVALAAWPRLSDDVLAEAGGPLA